MKTNQIYSVVFLIKTSKTKNGKAPIFCRISVNGKRSEVSLKKYIEPSKWISAAGIMKGSSEEARVINHQIDQLKLEINKQFNQMISEGISITSELLKQALSGEQPQEEQEMTLLELYKYHNDQMKDLVGGDVVKATYCKYLTSYSKTENFITKRLKVKDVPLSELNYKFVADFEHYLKANEKIGHNTTMKYIRNLKKVINMAVANEWLTRNPFDKFKCATHRVKREILTPTELKTIADKDFKIDRLEEVKDIFLFCCYTGYAFSDVEKLTRKDIAIGIDGNKWIHTDRKKTGTISNVPLLPFAQTIVEKYKDHEYCVNSNKLLPVKSNQKMNAYLKEIADLCNINKTLTMHMARHTFATTVTLSNGVPIETVSKMLGHTKLATTQIYAQVLENKIGHDMQALANKLSISDSQIEEKNTGTF